jgi:acyl-CoA reductase-like NAD-dependent aldehyde dehydrogenase
LDTNANHNCAGNGTVIMTPLGVAAAITTLNTNYSPICGKIALALAAGCTTVVKPSELNVDLALYTTKRSAFAGPVLACRPRFSAVTASSIAHSDQ